MHFDWKIFIFVVGQNIASKHMFIIEKAYEYFIIFLGWGGWGVTPLLSCHDDKQMQ